MNESIHAQPPAHPLLDARLADCRRIFLHNFDLQASIGFYDIELRHPQRIRLNIDLFVPLARSMPRSDSPDEIVDYDKVRRRLADVVAARHYNLQETLLEHIVEQCFAAHPAIRAVRASTEKPDIYPDRMSAGIEVFRFRQDRA